MLKEITDVAFKQQCKLVGQYETEFDFHFDPTKPLEAMIDKTVRSESNQAIEAVQKVHEKYPDLRIGISNICCCLPLDEPEVEGGYRQIRPPEKSEAEACRGRLLELIRVVRPKAIVALGRVPGKFIPRLKDGLPPFVQFIEETIHPAALCRLQADDPIRFIESRNRCLLTLTRLKHRIYGLDV